MTEPGLSELKTENTESTKILFFIQDPRSIEMATLQLEKLGYKICFARTTIEAFAQIMSFKPDVLLLSWNLKKMNIKSLYTHFADKLKSLVVVFSEINDPITIMKLNNSGIQNSLFPPLSGQGIHVRMQILIKRHKEAGLHVGKTDDIGFKPIEKESLPKDTQWRQVKSSSKVEEAVKLWKGNSVDSDSKTFFFESSMAPQQLFDESQQLMQGNDLVFMETDKAGEKLITEVHNARPDELHTIGDVFAEGPGVNAHLSLLSKLLKEAMAAHMSLTAEPKFRIKEVSAVNLFSLNTNRFKGYVVVSRAQGKPDVDLSQKIFNQLVKLLEENGESLNRNSDFMEVTFDKIQFDKWLERRKINFTLKGSVGDNEILFSFLQRDHFPVVEKLKDEKYMGCHVDEALVENTRLTFDLYLHFPKNEKFICYVKKNRVLTAKNLQKLMEYQVNHIYFTEEEEKDFYQYLASTFLDFS